MSAFLIESLTGARTEVGAKLVLGRGAESTLLVLDQHVTRSHCQLARVGGRVVLQDLGGSNGTFVNSVRVTTVMLAHGDRITIGSTSFTFHLGPGA
jgi:pSer/pThr/pTyr-binding forkhead associated (FHA) protein